MVTFTEKGLRLLRFHNAFGTANLLLEGSLWRNLLSYVRWQFFQGKKRDISRGRGRIPYGGVKRHEESTRNVSPRLEQCETLCTHYSLSRLPWHPLGVQIVTDKWLRCVSHFSLSNYEDLVQLSIICFIMNLETWKDPSSLSSQISSLRNTTLEKLH